ncbi:helix-turn-helix transcriptional regulator [Mycolicibacterium agri]|nr:helix-turn-helix transcriptional regulator [Mycolicibacterium agri]
MEDGPRRLLGRQREQQVLAGLLTAAREGRSGVVVLRGAAGIGKTSLLTYVLARASGFRAIRIAGFESEMELSYSGLQQFCAPLLGRLDRLPDPQQRALRIALGLTDGDPPDRLMVGLAVLTLLSEASSERPTICVIDDAQWVDAASLQALSFVARRILADPIVMIFAACQRRDDRLISDLPEVQVRGLNDDDARALLTTTVPGDLNEQVRENIIAEAGGNPLALMELHRVLSPAELAGGFGLAEAGQLTSRLERGFGRRLEELSDETATVLLIAAAEPSGEPRWLSSAAHQLGIAESAIEAAEKADLITVDSRVRFRHPLIRSAVYRGARTSERRRAHQALADVVDGPAAQEHRIWHLAHAANKPDEDLAQQLVRSAQQACARSGAAAAAAFLACAVELTPEQRTRAERALLAASAKLNSGAPEAASRLLMGASNGVEDELLSAKTDLLRAKAAFAASRGGEATSLLLATAKRLDDLDPELAKETYFEALTTAILAGRLANTPDTNVMGVAGAARHAATTDGAQRVVDLMLDALVTRVTDGYTAGTPVLKRAIEEFVRCDAADAVDLRWYDMATRICLDLFDHDAFGRIAARQLERLRAAGVLALLPVGLATSAAAAIFGGRLAEAAAHLAEAEAITTAIGGPPLRRSDPLLAAYRGQEARCREMAQATDGAVDHGQGLSIAAGLFALAVLHNGMGQYAEALKACETALEYDDFAVVNYTLAETVEAAIHCGDLAKSAEARDALVERATASGTDTALGLAARSRALTSDGPVAEAEYHTAISHFTRSPAVVYLARTHLVYGEWLRRQGRRVDARGQLRTAFQMFTEMGADGFAERTSRELEATGETVRRKRMGAEAELTTQETHIAKLAQAGSTNSEIAAALFISPRTVEWHMSKIFTKLGVTSRKELRKTELPVG